MKEREKRSGLHTSSHILKEYHDSTGRTETRNSITNKNTEPMRN